MYRRLLPKSEGYICSLTNRLMKLHVFSNWGITQGENSDTFDDENVDDGLAEELPEMHSDGEEEGDKAVLWDTEAAPVKSRKRKMPEKADLRASNNTLDEIHATIQLLLVSPQRAAYETAHNLKCSKADTDKVAQEVRRLKLPRGAWQQYSDIYFKQLYRPHRRLIPNPVLMEWLAFAILRFWNTIFPNRPHQQKNIVVFTAVCIHELSTGTNNSGIFERVPWLAASALHNENEYRQFDITCKSMTTMLKEIMDAVQPDNPLAEVNPGFRFPFQVGQDLPSVPQPPTVSRRDIVMRRLREHHELVQ